jgi:nitrate reductase gamma subunit
MAWISFCIFIFGSIYQLVKLINLAYQKERFIFTFWSFKYGLRSIMHWLVPFGPTNMRNNAVLSGVTTIFHICLLVTPIFLFSHIILWDEAWNISWIPIPELAADIMTLIVIVSCFYYLARRLKDPTVKYLTTRSDYVMLAIVAAPFITGFFAYHQWFAYSTFLNLHILSGEIMLMAIPFSRLRHMIFSPFTRAYMGSEFGGVRHSKDW